MGLIMMFRFKIKQSSLLFLALLLLSFNAFSAEWSLQIDCYDDDAQNEGTPNVVYTTFWAGNRQITNADGTVPGKALLYFYSRGVEHPYCFHFLSLVAYLVNFLEPVNVLEPWQLIF